MLFFCMGNGEDINEIKIWRILKCLKIMYWNDYDFKKDFKNLRINTWKFIVSIEIYLFSTKNNFFIYSCKYVSNLFEVGLS